MSHQNGMGGVPNGANQTVVYGGRGTATVNQNYQNSDERKFFVANLDFSWTSEGLKDWFAQSFGPVHYVKIVYSKFGKSKGYGFVHMSTDEGVAAVDKFANEHGNKVVMLGRTNVHLQKHDENRRNNGGFGSAHGDANATNNNVQHTQQYAQQVLYHQSSADSQSNPAQNQPVGNNTQIPAYQVTNNPNPYPNQNNGYSQGNLDVYPTQQQVSTPVMNSSQFPPQQQNSYYSNTGLPIEANNVPVAPMGSQQQGQYQPLQPPNPSLAQPVEGIMTNTQLVTNIPIQHATIPPPPPVSKILLTNVPSSANITDLISYLATCNATPSRCVIEYDTKSNTNMAHLEFNNHSVANNLVSLSQNGRLVYNGFILGCTSLNNPSASGISSISNISSQNNMPSNSPILQNPMVASPPVINSSVANLLKSTGVGVGVPRPPSNQQMPYGSRNGNYVPYQGRGGRGGRGGNRGRGRGFQRGGRGDGGNRGRGNQNRFQPY